MIGYSVGRIPTKVDPRWPWIDPTVDYTSMLLKVNKGLRYGPNIHRSLYNFIHAPFRTNADYNDTSPFISEGCDVFCKLPFLVIIVQPVRCLLKINLFGFYSTNKSSRFAAGECVNDLSRC